MQTRISSVTRVIRLLDDGREFVSRRDGVGRREWLRAFGFVYRDKDGPRGARRGWFRSPTRGDGARFG
jgi:hypothetical protein